ncbi:MAG: cysteine synthase A [Oscillospiraceae bacterium]
MIYNSILQLIGKTPLMRLEGYGREIGARGALLAKLEMFNPGGSIKDRVAAGMILDAEQKGLLKKGATIIEPTSGNTGIGIAAVAGAMGYKVIIVMPDTMSEERRRLMRAYGARLVLSYGKEGMRGSVKLAQRLCRETDGAVMLGQFDNEANPKTHFETTGPEIWEDTGGCVDYFVCGVGTGGTLTGVGKYLKSKNPLVKIIAVEPFDSPLLSKNLAGSHKLQGIGSNFVPGVLDRAYIDGIITVKTNEAYETAQKLAKCEGIFTGVSSGAALFAAGLIAVKEENAGKNIAVILPDTGERYLSTEDFIAK